MFRKSDNRVLPRIAALVVLATGGLAGCATTDPLHIFVLAGQSNMSGRGEVEEIDRTPHPRVYALNAQDEWVLAVEPLHFDKPRRAECVIPAHGEAAEPSS